MNPMSTPATPRKAAACLLVRDRGGLEVLLAKRNKNLRFMGGHYVFPGGSVHKDDDATRVAHAPDTESGRALCAAVREAFEETGILCVRGALPPENEARDARRRLLAGSETFGSILDRFRVHIDASDFVPAGEWVTPRWSPIRFHTRYFLHQYDGGRAEEVLDPDGEIVALDWMTPGEARRRWHMEQLRLSTPVAYVLRILAKLPLAEALPHLHRTPGLDDNIPNLFETRRGVHVTPLRSRTLPPNDTTNCIIIGEETLFVIDPAAADPEEQAHLKHHLDEMISLGGHIAAILLTHGHPDHCAAAPYLNETYGAPIWAHEAAADEAPFPVDRLLADGDTIPAGGTAEWRIRCFHTPGHDPGHLCFFEETTASLIVGDMVANPGTILINLSEGGDMTVYLEQLERLLGIDFRFLVPGHGMPLWRNLGKEKIRELIAHRLDRERQIKNALENGAHTLDEIVQQAYQDTPHALWYLAKKQVKAHLARLGVPLDHL